MSKTMGEEGVNREALVQLAALYHDPPWKPWAILNAVEGSGRKTYEGLARIIAGKLGERGVREAERFEKHATSIIDKIDVLSHEKQASLIPLTIAFLLRERATDNNKVLLEYSRLYERAARVILGLDDKGLSDKVKRADWLASGFDRYNIYSVLKKYSNLENENLERKPYTPREKLVLVNPFTLERQSIPGSIPAELVAEFVVEHATLVVEALSNIKVPDGKADSMLAVHVSYLLLEPVWYYVTSREGRIYAPPADTRIPHHTVFDHINAVLAVLNLTDNGCLAIVDLASVQQWILESRRLRDLWASSWLASFLAWKSIEALVKRYGPGVMVSPPGRLNPFYSTSIMGGIIQNLAGKHGEWIWEALGLSSSKKWPIDPVMPTRLLIALPGEACGRLEDNAKEGLKQSWKMIAGQVIEYVKAKGGEEALLVGREDAKSIMESLEPPLPLRVYTQTVETPRAGKDDDPSFYYKILVGLLAREDEIKISATGRRTGKAYHEHILKAYKEKGALVKCTVCGRAPAIIDASKLPENSNLYKELGGNRGERLCPYCLVKRLLRRVVIDNEKFAEKLVGLSPPNTITWSSIDTHTTRYRLAARLLDKKLSIDEELVVSLAKCFKKRGNVSSPELWHNTLRTASRIANEKGEGGFIATVRDVIAGVEDVLMTLVAGEEHPFIREDSGVEECAKIAGLIKNVVGIVKNVPRDYAIVKADGDCMGSGLLKGFIPRIHKHKECLKGKHACLLHPISPSEYLEGVALEPYMDSITNNRILQALREAALKYEENVKNTVVGGLEPPCGLENIGCGIEPLVPSTLVTPSYQFQVSRSLALVSMIDRMSADMAGADIVYLGGDDALLIAHPVELGRDGSLELTALRLALKLRESWSGTLKAGSRFDVKKGFLAVTVRGNSGEERIVHFGPAPGAYGRSVAVMLADAKHPPMWMSLLLAGVLEEAKDGSYTGEVGAGGYCSCTDLVAAKDIVAVGSLNRGAALGSLGIPLKSPGGVLRAAEKLLEAVRTGVVPKDQNIRGTRIYLSRSILTDVPGMYGDIIRSIPRVSPEGGRHLEKILLNVYKRNIRAEGRSKPSSDKAAQALHKEIKDVLEDEKTGGCWDGLSVGLLFKPSRLESVHASLARSMYLERTASSAQCGNGGEYAVLPLLLQVFALAYVYDSSLPFKNDYDRILKVLRETKPVRED